MSSRRVVLHIAASLDGFIATSDDGLEWLPEPNADEDFGMIQFMAEVDCVLMGRRTWDVTKSFDQSHFNGMKVHVFSRQSNDAIEFTRNLKTTQGKTIWLIGGGDLNASLLKANLVDEIVITYIPVELVQGIPLYGSLGVDYHETWEHVETVNFANGIRQERYLNQ